MILKKNTIGEKMIWFYFTYLYHLFFKYNNPFLYMLKCLTIFNMLPFILLKMSVDIPPVKPLFEPIKFYEPPPKANKTHHRWITIKPISTKNSWYTPHLFAYFSAYQNKSSIIAHQNSKEGNLNATPFIFRK